MDSRWFKEDREKYKGEELKEQMEQSKTALKNSTLFSRRLVSILEEEMEQTYRSDEDFSKLDWHTEAIANAATRKTIRRIIKLLP